LVGVEALELLEPPALLPPLDPAMAPALLLDPPPGLPAPPEFVLLEVDPPEDVPPATDPPDDELDDDELPPGFEVSLPPFEPPLLELPPELALELLLLEPPPDPEELLVLGAGLQPMTEANRMAARAAYREKPGQGWCI
jgi:hypothetical protein